jgi:hypothetical protein
MNERPRTYKVYYDKSPHFGAAHVHPAEGYAVPTIANIEETQSLFVRLKPKAWKRSSE